MKADGKAYIAIGLGVAATVLIGTGAIMVRTPVTQVHDSLQFAVGWRFWLLACMDVMPVALASAILIVFSLVLQRYDLPKATPLIRAVRGPMVVVVVFGLLSVLWQAALAPRTRTRIIQLEHQSSMAIQAWEDANDAYKRDDLREAREKAGLYGAITGESRALEEFLEELEVREVVVRNPREISQPEAFLGEPDVVEQSVVEFIELAQDFFDRGRYYSAHYFATRAVELSPVERLDARRVQQRAWEAIQDEGRAIEDSVESEYFDAKFTAYTAFQRSTDSPEMLIEAYYRFQELAEERPDDPDVQHYLPEIAAGLTGISFFLDAARSYETYPGVQNLVFENEAREYLTIDHLVQVREGDFVYGVEVIRVDNDGAVLYHLRAPYGKFIGGDLVLRAVRREGTGTGLEANLIGPVYFSGDRPPEMRSFFPMRHAVDEIVRFGPGAQWLDQENIAKVFTAIPLFARLGLPVSGIYAQLVERVLRGFGMFILLFASIAIGWRYRSRYLGRPPVLVMLTVPFFPLSVWGVAEFVRYLSRLILLFSFSIFGSTTGLALLVALPIIVLFWVLASLARQRTS